MKSSKLTKTNKKLLFCQICGDPGAKKRRQMTNYNNDKQNYATLCEECQNENDKYWTEMWREYYNGCM